MTIDPTVNVFAIPLKSRPRKPKVSKARQAMLTDRVQPIRRPVLRLKKTTTRDTK